MNLPAGFRRNTAKVTASGHPDRPGERVRPPDRRQTRGLSRAELDARYARSVAYIREHLCPDLTDEDLAEGERFWRELEQGRIPRP